MSANAVSSDSVLLDRVVATVNDEVITWSELRKAMEVERVKVAEGLPKEEREKQRRALEKTFLDRMIDMRLQMQEAKRLEIDVADSEVEEAINDIKAKYKMSDEMLRESLKREGLSPDEYRIDLSRQILISKLVNREVRANVLVSENDIEAYFASHEEEYHDEDKVKIRQIFFAAPGDASQKRDMEEVANLIVQRLRAGEDFAELAGKISEDASGVSGGDLGYIKRGSVIREVEEVAFALTPGEISDPFWSPAGLHIVLVEDFIGGTDVKSIREEIRKKLFEESFRSRHETWLRGLREKAYIEKHL